MNFESWLRRAADHPILTRAEEVALFKRIEQGDEAARERVITSNVRLAVMVALKYRGRGLELEDLVQESLLGLGKATTKFDWRRGFKLSTYAVRWCHAYTARAIENKAGVIRRPTHIHLELGQLERADRTLMTARGHEPTDAELAAATGMDVERVEFLRSLTQPASLDAPVRGHDDGEPTALGEFVEDVKTLSPHAEAVGGAMSAALEAALSQLGYRARRVLIARHGLDGSEPQTLDQLALTFGSRDAEGNVVRPLQRERVRQLEQQALDFLRHNHARELLAFIDERQGVVA